MNLEHLSDLRIFDHVVRLGSLAAAGRVLGHSAAVVSKRIQRLEEQLRTRLLTRSTRQLRLTETGMRFHAHCVRILAEIAEAEDVLDAADTPLRGALRVTAPTAFGQRHITPWLPTFLAAHPTLKVELELSDALTPIIAEGYDVALRIGEQEDSELVGQTLWQDRMVVVATPAYWAHHGIPSTPGQLAHHNAILFGSRETDHHWRFITPNGQTEQVAVSGNLSCNMCDAVRTTLLANLGLARRPLWDVWDLLAEKRLQAVLTEYSIPPRPIRLFYPSRVFVPRKVLAFRDGLKKWIGNPPVWEQSAPPVEQAGFSGIRK
ncbi:MAG: LysR family transcriptional regulator [Magnetococcales bacterium]|nr:LysR family transcriptional regulator [Magnetococcales bacterium]MBF0151664.1 LysR family transcriptional regulator [Magnetococcales bacterium]MBF0347708.1 LysR family transcriptional regulator [Magnetococcales bacterium]MBF0630613.1 LysR family transcriptional regulator [Magnetococcales bacterium]